MICESTGAAGSASSAAGRRRAERPPPGQKSALAALVVHHVVLEPAEEPGFQSAQKTLRPRREPSPPRRCARRTATPLRRASGCARGCARKIFCRSRSPRARSRAGTPRDSFVVAAFTATSDGPRRARRVSVPERRRPMVMKSRGRAACGGRRNEDVLALAGPVVRDVREPEERRERVVLTRSGNTSRPAGLRRMLFREDLAQVFE